MLLEHSKLNKLKILHFFLGANIILFKLLWHYSRQGKNKHGKNILELQTIQTKG